MSTAPAPKLSKSRPKTPPSSHPFLNATPRTPSSKRATLHDDGIGADGLLATGTPTTPHSTLPSSVSMYPTVMGDAGVTEASRSESTSRLTAADAASVHSAAYSFSSSRLLPPNPVSTPFSDMMASHMPGSSPDIPPLPPMPADIVRRVSLRDHAARVKYSLSESTERLRSASLEDGTTEEGSVEMPPTPPSPSPSKPEGFAPATWADVVNRHSTLRLADPPTRPSHKIRRVRPPTLHDAEIASTSAESASPVRSLAPAPSFKRRSLRIQRILVPGPGRPGVTLPEHNADIDKELPPTPHTASTIGTMSPPGTARWMSSAAMASRVSLAAWDEDMPPASAPPDVPEHPVRVAPPPPPAKSREPFALHPLLVATQSHSKSKHRRSLSNPLAIKIPGVETWSDSGHTFGHGIEAPEGTTGTGSRRSRRSNSMSQAVASYAAAMREGAKSPTSPTHRSMADAFTALSLGSGSGHADNLASSLGGGLGDTFDRARRLQEDIDKRTSIAQNSLEEGSSAPERTITRSKSTGMLLGRTRKLRTHKSLKMLVPTAIKKRKGAAPGTPDVPLLPERDVATPTPSKEYKRPLPKRSESLPPRNTDSEEGDISLIDLSEAQQQQHIRTYRDADEPFFPSKPVRLTLLNPPEPAEDETFSVYRHPSDRRLLESATQFVIDEEGNPVSFDSLFPVERKDVDKANARAKRSQRLSISETLPPRTLLFFIRSMWCGFCQDYTSQSINKLNPQVMAALNVRVVIICNSSYKMIKRYRDLFKCPFPFYSDESSRIYKLFGMVQNNLMVPMPMRKAPGVREEYNRNTPPVQMMRSFKNIALHLNNSNPGNVFQMGGEFVLGPNYTCEFAHRMTLYMNHLEAREVLGRVVDDETFRDAERRVLHKEQAVMQIAAGQTAAGPAPAPEDVEMWRDSRTAELERMKNKRIQRRQMSQYLPDPTDADSYAAGAAGWESYVATMATSQRSFAQLPSSSGAHIGSLSSAPLAARSFTTLETETLELSTLATHSTFAPFAPTLGTPFSCNTLSDLPESLCSAGSSDHAVDAEDIVTPPQAMRASTQTVAMLWYDPDEMSGDIGDRKSHVSVHSLEEKESSSSSSSSGGGSGDATPRASLSLAPNAFPMPPRASQVGMAM
ncbi:uncharacterized protein LOC62_05G007571 [Vanrija pseudolonga]|uniref:Thioredoxin domain-containing protein n=1 Tax=Vanrija pseudolonga TaxID=143232 RepID=A0AAF0YC55_9TREE|nr:hypothetical protein LOC62_05G007571 [Vanrija pseudolonga]